MFSNYMKIITINKMTWIQKCQIPYVLDHQLGQVMSILYIQKQKGCTCNHHSMTTVYALFGLLYSHTTESPDISDSISFSLFFI